MINFYQGDGKGRKKGSKEVIVLMLDDFDSQLSYFCNIYYVVSNNQCVFIY